MRFRATPARAARRASCALRAEVYLEFKMRTDQVPRTAEEATALKLWVVLTRAQHSVARCARSLVERHGLSTTEFAVLEVLYSKGALPVGEIGARVLLTSGSMTYVTDKLVERGLIVRRPCGEDQRVIYVALTPEGEALMDRAFPEYSATIGEALGDLDEAEQQAAIELLKRIGRCASGICER